MAPISIEQQDVSSAGSLKVVNNNLKQSLLAGCITFLTTTPLSAFAESVDDLEIADLPPVFVPILFAIGVLGGVGVLTASLGNVMDEGELNVLFDIFTDFSKIYHLTLFASLDRGIPWFAVRCEGKEGEGQKSFVVLQEVK